jgi:mRNA interferase RelE/StbE
VPWKVEYAASAVKAMRKIEPATRQRLRSYMEDHIAGLDDPRSHGYKLSGPLRGLWRYRVGDHRIICQIIDVTEAVLVLKVGHRREVYRG